MRARLALRAVPFALLASVALLPASAQDAHPLEAALSDLVSSGFCRAAFAPAIEAAGLPDVVGLAGSEACDRIALALGGDWGCVGSVVWFRLPGPGMIPDVKVGGPLPRVGGEPRTWRIRGPVRLEAAGLAGQADERLATALMRLVDGASFERASAGPATGAALESLLRASLGSTDALPEWRLSGRLLPSYWGPYVEWPVHVRALPGDVPVAVQQVSLASGTRTLGDAAARLVQAASRGAVEIGKDLHGSEVVAVAEGARADEALCALALAAGGSWRQVGDLVFLAPRRAGRAADAEPIDGWTRAVLSLTADGSQQIAALSDPSRPMLLEGSLGTRGVRVLLHAHQPSRAVLRAVERRYGEVAPHCLAESVEGFAAGVGRPLAQERVDALRAATQDQGPLDGNRLIALAKEAGVELVGVKGTLDEIGEKRGVAIVHLTWGHYVAVTDCDSAFVTLLGADGRRARFPKDALESGMSGIMFVAPELLDERPAALRAPGGMFGVG